MSWEWRDPENGSWAPQQRVRFTIQGGREDGYRAYSSKTAPRPGQWRVNIATGDGRAIGRVRFAVETQAVPPAVSVKDPEIGSVQPRLASRPICAYFTARIWDS